MPLSPQPHEEMCQFLASPYSQNRLMLVPRGTWKTSNGSIAFPLWMVLRAWFIEKNPCYRALIDSATVRLSKLCISTIEATVKNSATFEETFGNLYDRKGKVDEGYSLAFRLGIATGIKEPNFLPSGVGAEKTGLHFELIVLDDIVTKENSYTPAMRDKVFNHYRMMQGIIESTKAEGQTTVLQISGTRYHDDDTYGRIIKEDDKAVAEGKPQLFTKLIRQAINYETGELYYPDKLDKDELERRRRQMGVMFFCTPAETPILMADFSELPIANVAVGDEVVGFSISHQNKVGPRGKGPQRTALRAAKVTGKFEYEAEVEELLMESGRTVRCTPEHKWYTSRFATGKEPTRRTYAPAQPGLKLMLVSPPEETNMSSDRAHDWAWLGGFFDGEGTAKGSALSISQSPTANPVVCGRLNEVLGRLGLAYKTYTYPAARSTGLISMWNVRDRRQLSIDLIRYGKLAKAGQLRDWIWTHGKKVVSSEDRVLSVRPIGKMPVYALQTESGNYVAWGYASSNSQFQNDPNQENAPFKREWLKWKSLINFPKLQHIRLTADLALKTDEAERGDYTAMVVMGWDQFHWPYVVDVTMKDNMTPGGFINEFFRLCMAWNLKSAIIEADHQESLEHLLRLEMHKRGFFVNVRWEKASRSYGKMSRWAEIQPYAERGGVHIAEEIPSDVRIEVQDQWERAPVASHDDFMDALSLQMLYLPIEFEKDGGRLVTGSGVEPAQIAAVAKEQQAQAFNFGTLAQSFPHIKALQKREEGEDDFEPADAAQDEIYQTMMETFSGGADASR